MCACVFFLEKAHPAEHKDTQKKTLLIYCLGAWGLPAVVTVTCFALDHFGAFNIGYGKSKLSTIHVKSLLIYDSQ